MERFWAGVAMGFRMRFIMKILSNILLLLTLTLTATATSIVDTNCVNSVSVETNGYRFTLCTTNINPKAGEIVTVQATLKNISPNDVTIALSVPLRDYMVQVLWQGKQNMDLTLYGKHSKNDILSSSKGTLESGRQITASFEINKLFDMTNAGDYEIVMSHRIRIHNDTAWGTITAPPLKITLKEP
jgi:hypothetical protein